MADYIPTRNGDLAIWAANFKAKLAIHGATLGYTAPQVLALQARCDNVINAINEAEQAKAGAAQAVENLNISRTDEVAVFRTEANRMKTHAAYTAAIGDDLLIVSGPTEEIDYGTFAPTAGAKAFPEDIEIKFKKAGRIDGMNIYRRAVGTMEWGNKIAYDTNSPYQDFDITAGSAYDYRIIAVDNDVQVGQETVVGNVRAL